MSEKARPAAEAINAILGKGVSPESFSQRLAIEIEDNGMFRNRCERIENFAKMLAETAELLKAEASRRRNS